MFKTRDWFVLAPIAVLALVLAIWGYYPCVGVNCKPDSLWTILQESFNLVRGGGNYVLGKDPISLVLAQYLLPAIAIIAAAKLFLLNLRRDIRVAFARQSSNHTIVCGLGETGRNVVDNLRSAGERVVAIDLDGDQPNARSCEHAGVPVIKGDATVATTLALAGLSRARALVATTGNDTINFEIALRASHARELAKATANKLAIHPEIRADWFLNGIVHHQRATLGSPSVEMRPFNQYENAARLLYRSSAFARRRDSFAATAPHIIMIGLDRMGREILAHGIRIALAVPGALPRITIVDTRGEAAAAPFFAIHRGVRDVADINVIETALGDDAAGWNQLNAVLEKEDITAVIVALPDDDSSLAVALRIRRYLDEYQHLTTPVLARLRERQKLGEFTANLERVGPLRHRFIPFGDLAYLTSATLLFEQRLDSVARAHHDIYRDLVRRGRDGAAHGSPEHTVADLPWERLPEIYKQSNRNFADHVPVKLRAAGLRMRAAKAPRPIPLSDDEVERLAMIEHWRWTVERRMAGWTQGAERDEIRRRHPALVPWEALPEAVREQNRAPMRLLPQLVAAANLEIRRERTISAVSLDARGLDEELQRAGHADRFEHLAVIVDLENPRSLEAAKRAVEIPDASIWIMLTDSAIAGLGRAYDASADHRRLWNSAEGWITTREFDGLPHAKLRQGDA
jgi:TrkA-N domain/RyR domain